MLSAALRTGTTRASDDRPPPAIGGSGVALGPVDAAGAAVQRVRAQSDIPVAVGFGVRTPEQARKLASIRADVPSLEWIIGFSATKADGCDLTFNLRPGDQPGVVGEAELQLAVAVGAVHVIDPGSGASRSCSHVRDDFGKEPTVPAVATPDGWKIALFSAVGAPMVAARVFETLRTDDRQRFLYGFGREYDDGRGVVTNSRTAMDTWHGFGLAVDIVDRAKLWNAPDDFWWVLGTSARRHGLVWGADWNGNWSSADERFMDRPHIQWGNGMRRRPSALTPTSTLRPFILGAARLHACRSRPTPRRRCRTGLSCSGGGRDRRAAGRCVRRRCAPALHR